MRISDWSSDVCSSDLIAAQRADHGSTVARQRLDITVHQAQRNQQVETRATTVVGIERQRATQTLGKLARQVQATASTTEPPRHRCVGLRKRSEERRVGKEDGRTCRYRGGPQNY